MSLILSGRSVKERMCWVSLWIKGNSSIAIKVLLILGQHIYTLIYKNNCIPGSHTEILFYWELYESLLGTLPFCTLIYLEQYESWLIMFRIRKPSKYDSSYHSKKGWHRDVCLHISHGQNDRHEDTQIFVSNRVFCSTDDCLCCCLPFTKKKKKVYLNIVPSPQALFLFTD